MKEELHTLQRREFFYALYSRIFINEADIPLLEMIEKEEIRDLFANLFKWDLYNTLSKDELIQKHLNVDFTEISLLNLIPYESFYTREDAMIQSGGENPVIQFYERFDFMVEKDKARIVSPDHIGAELEFMYMLCGAQIKALRDGDISSIAELKEIQKEFLEKHLIQWAPLYLINVKNEAQTPLYHDSAMTGLEFILSDFEYLNA